MSLTYVLLLLLPMFSQASMDQCERLSKYCRPKGNFLKSDGFVKYEIQRFRCPRKNYNYEGPIILECARAGVCHHPATRMPLNVNLYEVQSVNISVTFTHRKNGFREIDVPIAFICTKSRQLLV